VWIHRRRGITKREGIAESLCAVLEEKAKTKRTTKRNKKQKF